MGGYSIKKESMKMYPNEKIYANYLDSKNIKWEYPSKTFVLKGTTYRPDFYLPDMGKYIEVVGTRQAYHINKYKISLFLKKFPNINFEIVNPDGSNFISNFDHKRKDKINNYKGKSISRIQADINPKIYRDFRVKLLFKGLMMKDVVEMLVARWSKSPWPNKEKKK